MTVQADTVAPTRRLSLPAWDGWRRPSWALYALLALVLAGVILRILASAAGWPVFPTLADSWPYSYYAGSDVFANPQHPPGYSIFLAAVGLFTHSVGVFVVLQHLMGIATALIFFAGIRRLCGSPWPGLVAAAVVLLDADLLYLEDQIMSEVLFTFLLALVIYAAARTLEKPERWWPWPIAMGVFVQLLTMTRTSGLVLVPILFLAVLLIHRRPWRPRIPAMVAFIVTAVVMFVAQAGISAIDGNTFRITPSPGWHLYGRAAEFASCKEFTPPPGTASLCEETAIDQRPGFDWYLFDPSSPAVQKFKFFGFGDSKLKEFSEEAILHQPRAFLESVWPEIEAYFLPESYGQRTPGHGTDIDGQLDWALASTEGDETEQQTQEGMESFFSPFTVERNQGLISFFHDYQRIFRFGGTMLTVSTLLILLGLLVGTRRRRIAVFVLGIGGLAMLILPAFSANYVGRYMVPMSPLYAAGAVIAAMSLVAWMRSFRKSGSEPASAAL